MPRDIAILRLDHIGDAILTSGFLEALRTAWPDSRIEVWCGQAAASFFSRCPTVNSVMVLPFLKPYSTPGAEVQKTLESFRQHVVGRHDILINPRCAPDDNCAGLYAAASEIPERVAFRQRYFNSGYNPNASYTSLVDIRLPAENAAFVGRHILSALDISVELPVPKIVVGRRALERAAAWLPGERYVALGIGASVHHHRWPPENFAIVADVLAARGFSIVLIGSPGERDLASVVKASTSAPLLDLVGQTDLEDIAAVAARCVVFVGNDSAPKHLAASMQTPVVEISWLGEDTPGFDHDSVFDAVTTKSIRVGPALGFSNKQALSGESVRSIAPEEVLAAVDAILKQ